MKRSEFLRLSCTGCLLGGAGLLSVTELLSCSPAAKLTTLKVPVTNRQIEVPLAKLHGKHPVIVRGSGMEYDIAVHALPDGSYAALLLRCTHFSNPLVSTGNGYHCDLHGSEFDAAGQVTKGPAAKALTKLRCEMIGANLIIHV